MGVHYGYPHKPNGEHVKHLHGHGNKPLKVDHEATSGGHVQRQSGAKRIYVHENEIVGRTKRAKVAKWAAHGTASGPSCVSTTMADSGDQVHEAGTSMVEQQVAGARRKGRAKSRDPSRARDEMGDVETRLAKVELHLVNGDETFEELENRLLELVEGMDETRDELQGG
ncbi:hypothetical protein GH714_005628 [Hevea brasiliensis]|uniref:Uncharacterized protein n=1 Tax=Hevea brasiliensis TaxID=3981 RepID=A0A6A6K9R2_HEVBR|nr:hypothetical protein GH714_005628 [Hevea brasiliensis]